MKKIFSVLAAGLFLLITSAGFAFAQPAGKAIVDKACIKCHGIKRVETAKKNAAEWEVTVDRMIKKGADVKPAERTAVLQYLNTINK
jgi:mono/diheme cytochrome c family protein